MSIFWWTWDACKVQGDGSLTEDALGNIMPTHSQEMELAELGQRTADYQRHADEEPGEWVLAVLSMLEEWWGYQRGAA